jgi:hypothetical protein
MAVLSNAAYVDKARTWWQEHRQGLMNTLELALNITEKALVVVPHAQAAVGAAGAALKGLRVSRGGPCAYCTNTDDVVVDGRKQDNNRRDCGPC